MLDRGGPIAIELLVACEAIDRAAEVGHDRWLGVKGGETDAVLFREVAKREPFRFDHWRPASAAAS